MYKAAVFALLSVAGVVAAAPAIEERSPGHTGRGTVYHQHGAFGSCGKVHADTDLIAAIGHSWMGGPNSKHCGKKVIVTNMGSDSGTGGKGNTVNVTVADTCMSCGLDHIDLSIGAWNKLTGNAPFGKIHVKWDFV